MTCRRALLLWVPLFGASLLLGSMAAGAQEPLEPLAIVIAKGSTLSDIPFHQLKQAFLGGTINSPTGDRVIPLNRGLRSSERAGFDRTVLGMRPDDIARYWIDRRIRGQSGSPKAVDPANVMQRVVARVPGAIGYVRLSQVSPDVKVLLVDGKRPSDVGYAISAPQQWTGAHADTMSLFPATP